jgi:hypothetical protein
VPLHSKIFQPFLLNGLLAGPMEIVDAITTIDLAQIKTLFRLICFPNYLIAYVAMVSILRKKL